jgi:hypothetical protein
MLFNILKSVVSSALTKRDENGKFEGLKVTPFIFISIVLSFLIYAIAAPDLSGIDDAYHLAIQAIISIAAPAGVAAINTIIQPSKRRKD